MAESTQSHTADGAASDSVTSQSEAAMQDVSVAPGGSAEPGGAVAHGTPASTPVPYPSYHGRRISWIAVSIMMVGVLVGGLAMVVGGGGGPIWWLFWTGAGVTALGLLISLATNTFEDWY